MKFRYTSHALYQIQERRLNKHDIEETVLDSEAISPSRFNTYVVHKEVKNKRLRVVYKKDENAYTIR